MQLTFFYVFFSEERDKAMKMVSKDCCCMERPSMVIWFSLLLFLVLQILGSLSASNNLIDLGSYDLTGPAADVNLMGYANMEQIASGIHRRLRAWASLSWLNLKGAVYGELNTEKNVAISSIHSLAGPQGYLQYVVYIVTSLGFVRQSFDVIVNGIEIIIMQAHENLRPGSILINKGELLDAGINHSPSAYLNNPADEWSNYKYNVDKEMTLIKFVDEEWGPIGSFNWFATLGTSMSRTNSLIGDDNKGAAARFMEDWFEQTVFMKDFDSLPFSNELMEIAASFKSSQGRPATRFLSVARWVRNALRQADRPQFVSALNTLGIAVTLDCRVISIIAPAMGRMNSAMAGVQDFSNLEVSVPKVGGGNEVVKKCPAAMGFAFAAGTTDGSGAFDFTQGDNQGNAFWRLVRNLLKTPNQEQINCQKPKPILFDTGKMKQPLAVIPSILPVQILRIEQLVILSVPAEFTTMAGWCLRDAVKTVLMSGGNRQFDSIVHIVVAGMTNTYSQYVSTYEVYQVQSYEGAPNLYGPHALNAWIQEFKKLAAALISGGSVEPGLQPSDLLDKQISLLTPVLLDATSPAVNFRDDKDDVPNSTFKRGDVVSVTFWSACPRNDLMTEGTFALVELLQDQKTWIPAYDDDDICSRFKWSRPAKLSLHSYATIEWRIPESVDSGVSRIRHFGASKSIFWFNSPFYRFFKCLCSGIAKWQCHISQAYNLFSYYYQNTVVFSPTVHTVSFRLLLRKAWNMDQSWCRKQQERWKR
ncbi:hypothetical protein CRYUN_Cryun09bG0012100 [Craigia yunnanensis]